MILSTLKSKPSGGRDPIVINLGFPTTDQIPLEVVHKVNSSTVDQCRHLFLEPPIIIVCCYHHHHLSLIFISTRDQQMISSQQSLNVRSEIIKPPVWMKNVDGPKLTSKSDDYGDIPTNEILNLDSQERIALDACLL